jgi:dTDP-4-dehydrorhamnose 3,5-epimerase
VVKDAVFDVAVDIRRTSATYGQWVGEILSEENKKQLWVSEGIAHGLVTLIDNTEFQYKTTNYYAPTHERAMIWNDPTLAIDWPIDIQPLISAKDREAEHFVNADVFA